MPGPSAGRSARILGLTGLVILLNVFGNLSLDWGMKHISEAVGINPLHYLKAMVNPFVALGIALLIIWLLTRMVLLSWADLTLVLPLTAVGYVINALLDVPLLHETVSPRRWAGTFCIFAGVALVSTALRGETNKEPEVQPLEKTSA
jgi:drug/metabolite transporter (DMT)-like permease